MAQPTPEPSASPEGDNDKMLATVGYAGLILCLPLVSLVRRFK
jgi:hypothetical protein